ncbi:MAG: STAS domain-containing protein [SAR324 cluster bacterium]|nr:STAS domain-containing protein [SAR324 cluster bacterium]
MKLTYRIEDEICIVDLEGGFSQEETKETKLFFARLSDEVFKACAINLSKVIFLDSIIIGTIMSFFRKCREKQRAMVICAINIEVQWLFWNRYEDLLKIFETEEEAITYLTITNHELVVSY